MAQILSFTVNIEIKFGCTPDFISLPIVDFTSKSRSFRPVAIARIGFLLSIAKTQKHRVVDELITEIWKSKLKQKFVS